MKSSLACVHVDELIDCLSGQEPFQIKADDTRQRAIQRLSQLEPHLRDFVLRLRLREGHLSRAILTGSTRYNSAWHLATHELAKARMYSMASGQRQSRAAAWFNVQASVCPTAAVGGQADSWTVRPVQRYKPYTAEDLQVLVYTAADKTIQLGIVLCVYRGAIITSNKGTRSLKSTKPSAVPLTGHLCKAVRVVQLTQYSASSFFSCNLSKFEVVEVLGHVHGEACPRRIDAGLDKLRMSFCSEVLDAVRFIQNNPASLMTIKEIGATQPEKAAFDGPKNFGAGDFTRTLAGCKAIEDWWHCCQASTARQRWSFSTRRVTSSAVLHGISGAPSVNVRRNFMTRDSRRTPGGTMASRCCRLSWSCPQKSTMQTTVSGTGLPWWQRRHCRCPTLRIPRMPHAIS